MTTEVLRIISEWLDDATNGVAPSLLALPIDTGVTRPTPTIHDASNDDAVAEGLIPAGVRAAILVTMASNPITFKTNRNVPVNATANVLVRFVFRNYKTAEAMNHASLMLRALRSSLARLESTTAGATARSRGSVQLVSLAPIEVMQTMESVDDAWTTHAIPLTWDVRELFP